MVRITAKWRHRVKYLGNQASKTLLPPPKPVPISLPITMELQETLTAQSRLHFPAKSLICNSMQFLTSPDLFELCDLLF